ncbi:MAG: hypothetical protein KDC27_08445 [Acidobacteria bacterium]|nr:hypothetical protein [Acidobacteriota bacterium]
MEARNPLRSWQTLVWALAIFALNALICRELFFTEYTIHLGSIEAAYIGISRYAIDHPFEWDWFPLWYDGIPYHNTYPPLLHLIVAFVAWASNISPALSHHVVTAFFYALGPVALYLLALQLSGKHYPSVLAAVGISLLSPARPLLSQLQTWITSARSPTRLHSLVEFGDGPHITSITFLLLALMALHYALAKPNPWRIFLAAGALASVVLTNWLGAFALALSVASYLLSRTSERRWVRLTLWSAAAGAIAYGLAATWIPPSAIADIRHNAQHTIGHYPMTPKHFLYGGCVLAALLLLWMFFRRRPPRLIEAFSAYLLLLFGSMVLTDDWLGIQLMPQPARYHHELEIAMCLLGAFLLGRFAERLPRKWETGLFVSLIVALVAVQYRFCRREAKQIIQAVDMEQTVDYQASKWFGEHYPNDRVFISGSVQFWLNAFADTQQLGGGFGQGIVNRTIPAVHYGIPWTMGDGEHTAMWLRLYGCQAVAVSSPEGRDYYKEVWRDADKFKGVLPELWRDGGDAIYEVPQRTRSLAHVILPKHIPYKTPENNVDVAPVEPLVRALEDPALPLASFEWTTPSDIRIESELEPDQLLFVQVTHHPGWRAWVNGEPRRVSKDATGQMIVEPRCAGPCAVTMRFDGGVEMLLARLLCALTLLGGCVWGFFYLRAGGEALH